MKNFSLQLHTLFKEDQRDRSNGKLWEKPEFLKEVSKRDRIRRKKIADYLKKEMLKTPEDFYYAAMIFQHGESVRDYRQANQLAQQSMEMGYEPAKWLYAASLDRLLLHQGKPQKYGTQYRKEQNGLWFMPAIDPSVLDEERKQYNVPALSDMLAKIKKMNRIE